MSLYFLVSYWQFGVFLPSSSYHVPSVHASLFTLHSFYKDTCLTELEAHHTPVPHGSEGKSIPLAMQETQEMQVQSLGREDPLAKGMATHSSILA